jgi:hypothetical protein
MKISPDNPELIELLRKELGFHESAIIKKDSMLKDSYPVQFDLIIEEGSKTYVVELKRIVRLEGLSQLGLLKLLLNTSDINTYGILPYNIQFVIVGRRITPEAAEAAEKIGIRFIKLPADMYPEEAHDKPNAVSVCQWRHNTVQLWRDKIDHPVQKLSPRVIIYTTST